MRRLLLTISETSKTMKNTIVNARPEMVATFLVSTLIMASEKSAALIRKRPTGYSVLPMVKLSGVFQVRFSGCL